MKVSSSIVAALLLAVSPTQAAGLVRGSSKTSTQSQDALTEAEFGTATVILSHTSTTGKWDNKVINDAFKQAYNDVHTGDGVPYVSWSFVDMEVETPENDSQEPGNGHWESTNWLRYKYICPSCLPEDKKNKKLLPPLMLGALDYPDLHSEFESTFCKLISQADSASFGEVSKCQIDFTYSLTDAVGQHYHGKTDDDDKAADYSGELRGEFDLSHVLKTDDDASVLQNRISAMGNCFKDTYNMVHADSPYTFTGFTLEREIEIPEEDDDESALTDPDRLDWFRLPYRAWATWRGSYGCSLCAPDDRKFVPPLAMSRLTMGEHQAFEATFANCLRESGVPAFRKVTNPRIRFAYTGDQEMA